MSYNKSTFGRQLIVVQHSKRILYGSWNKVDKLAMVNLEFKRIIYLKQYPLDLQFGDGHILCGFNKGFIVTISIMQRKWANEYIHRELIINHTQHHHNIGH